MMQGKGMCPMRRPTSRVHVHHQNDQDPRKFHIARLHYIQLLSVVCYAAHSERQKAFGSGSPQNALLTGLRMHACMSRPTHMGSLAGLDAQ